MTSPEAPAVATLPLGAAFQSGDAASLPKRCPTCEGRYPADFRVCPRDASPLEDAPADEDPLIGAVLSDTYEVVRVIGEGGMGRVYEARHQRLRNKRYAIKVLHSELAGKPEVVSRFQREAEAASALLHPNVVGVYDVNRAPDGRPYIVAELLEGEQLGELLEREGKLPPARAVRIVRQICRALIAAHSRGIVHRDVKPENVCLVGESTVPSVKVLDFGISKVAELGSDLTRTGVVMGTPAYMAPEQARGDKVDARADIYAVGAILYRAITGRRPFEGLDQMATLTAVLTEEPPRPRAVDTAVPEALELVIQRAMARSPEDRYQTMSELEAELAPFDQAELSSDARTLLAARAPDLSGASRRAKLARPLVVGFSLAAWLWLFALVVAAVLSLIRLFSGEVGPTDAELVLTAVGTLVLLATPTVLWVRWLLTSVWRNTPRVIEIGDRLKRALSYAVGAFGAEAVAGVLWQLAIERAAPGLAWPGWALLGCVGSLAAAAAGWFLPALGRPRG